MARKTLHTQIKPDFLLWGIISPLGGHRICWELNHFLGLDMKRMEDVGHDQEETGDHNSFCFYSYYDEMSFFKVELIRNKDQGDFFLKELKQFDYLLMIKGELDFVDREEFTSFFKKLPSVQAAFEVDLSKIKTAEYLILE